MRAVLERPQMPDADERPRLPSAGSAAASRRPLAGLTSRTREVLNVLNTLLNTAESQSHLSSPRADGKEIRESTGAQVAGVGVRHSNS